MPSANRNSKNRQKKKRSRAGLSKGRINKLIDQLWHPHFHKRPVPIFLDSLSHFIVEQNPEQSLQKFLQFNFGPLLRETIKLVRAYQKNRVSRN